MKVLLNSRNKAIKNISGNRYAYLVAVDYIESRGRPSRAFWSFKCDCGTIKILNRLQVENGKTKSCGCFKKVTSKNTVARGIYSNYKLKAKHEGIPFAVTEELFIYLLAEKCHYCKIPFSNFIKSQSKNTREFHLKYNGIDRKEPEIGYVEENIVPCCKICNRAKSNMNYDEYKQWIKHVKTS